MIRTASIMTCLALVCLFCLSLTAEAQKTMSIQVKEAQLRATPSHLGKIVAKITYGSPVAVLETRGDWKKVSLAGGKAQGWLHNTALTSKKIALRAGQGAVGTSVSRDEIALAGKGFSEEVESQYRKSNKNLDYAWIDRMESIKASPEQMQDFVSDGRLVTAGEGGRP